MPEFVADFHIHSKYSRAVSQNMILEELDAWADDKGMLVMGTGDFTHPAWFKEIQAKLEPAEPGLFRLKRPMKRATLKGTVADTRFILTVEISGIYSRHGRTRRIHNLVFMPDMKSVEKLNAHLGWIGNVASDGRPILGLDSEELLKIVLSVNPDAAVIPAHCLLPNTVVHTKNDLLKPIQEIQKGDYVITHNNRWRRVTDVFKRPYHGTVYRIQPRNFSPGLTATSEHPFYAIKTHKNCHSSKGICKPAHEHLADCRHQYFRDYKPQWLMAHQLERGDVLVYPRFRGVFPNHTRIDMRDVMKKSELDTDVRGEYIVPIGNRVTGIRQHILINKDFCKLAGYYLAEGYLNNRDLIGFAFSKKEEEYVREVIALMRSVFGFDKEAKLKTDRSGGIEVLFYSKILCEAFRNLFYVPGTAQNASTKALPYWALGLPPDLQVEMFRCWWRGDAGYTVSRLLMNQMKIILLRLGIVPSIYYDSRADYEARGKHVINGRTISARYGLYSMNRLTFFEDTFCLLNEPEFASVARYNRGQKYGWMDEQYAYLPIYDITTETYHGEVFNLEVEEDNSYTCEFATVHNCWTPWFSVFGSMSGFDSLEECFGDHAKHIFAVETGLSSDPPLNWRLSKLDRIALISNSDSHSLERIGREANVFDCDLSYKGIMEAIKNSRINADLDADKRGLNISENPRSNPRESAGRLTATVEFFPEEGKYHYDGHRDCKISWAPEETKAHRGICTVCGKPVTVGVLNRVSALADRPRGYADAGRVPYRSVVPLDEIIGEALGVGHAAKSVRKEYEALIRAFGSELVVLTKAPIDEIGRAAHPTIAEGVSRMRSGTLTVVPGYDGEYGKVRIFGEGERKEARVQRALF